MPKWTDTRAGSRCHCFGDWSAGRAHSTPVWPRRCARRSSAASWPRGTRLPPERPLAEALEREPHDRRARLRQRLREQGLVESPAGQRDAGSPAARRSSARASRDERSRSFLGRLARAPPPSTRRPTRSRSWAPACPGSGLALDEEWRAAEADVAELACGTGYSPQGLLAAAPRDRRPLRDARRAHDAGRDPGDERRAAGDRPRGPAARRRAARPSCSRTPPTWARSTRSRSRAPGCVPVPVGATGVDVRALRRARSRRRRPSSTWCRPSTTPRARVMPEGARREVAALAEATRRRGRGGREPRRPDASARSRRRPIARLRPAGARASRSAR